MSRSLQRQTEPAMMRLKRIALQKVDDGFTNPIVIDFEPLMLSDATRSN